MNNENIYSTDAILQMYGITNYTMKGVERFIQYMGMRGVKLELVEPARGRRKSMYKILSSVPVYENEEWKECPQYPTWEFSNYGHVRNSATKKYYGQGQKQVSGYFSIAIDEHTRLPVHRGVMMSFNPIEHPENFVVDHINGVRSDNKLQNLRWVLQTQNAKFSDDNNTQIREVIAKIIQKYGYEITMSKLTELLE